MGGVGKAARNGRSASVCLILVLVLGSLVGGQSNAIWKCLKHCALHCIGFPLSAVFCADRCLLECAPQPPNAVPVPLISTGTVDRFDVDQYRYRCKLGCITTDHQCSNIIRPPVAPSPNSQNPVAVDDRAEKMEGYCQSCFDDCEKN